MDILKFLKKYNKGVLQGTRRNQITAKPSYYKFNEVDIEEFNKIYRTLYKSNLNKIIRTKSGAIAKGAHNRANYYAWDIKNSKTGARITALVDGYIFVFKIGNLKDKDNVLSPIEAWKTFVEACYKEGIDIDDYAIENGEEEKKLIEAPKISMKYHMLETDDGLDNCHHIDFHNSYPAGLCIIHPEFRKVIEPMYKLRKVNETYKAVLNFSIGAMQSTKYPWYARWAHLAKDAINNNNKRVDALAWELSISGREVIGFNTDGIWYRGEIYHGKGEGPNIGEWHNDHVNCLFRSKMDGSYEFIENGQYNPVVRGLSDMDSIEPDRTKWHWGDIYRQNTFKLRFEEGIGITYEEKCAQ